MHIISYSLTIEANNTYNNQITLRCFSQNKIIFLHKNQLQLQFTDNINVVMHKETEIGFINWGVDNLSRFQPIT